MICSPCKKPGYRGQNYVVRNRSIGKLPFLGHNNAWCGLHRTNQHDNTAYIVQWWRSKHGSNRYHRFGQQSGKRKCDTKSTTLVDDYGSAASLSSFPAHISYFFITASSRSVDTSSNSSAIFHLQLQRVLRPRPLLSLFIIAFRRHRLLAHRNVVKRSQHKAHPRSVDKKQTLPRHSICLKAPVFDGYGTETARTG